MEKEKEKEKECPICYESYNINGMITTTCNHIFCKTCIQSHATIPRYGNICCPLCRYEFNDNDLFGMLNMPLNNFDYSYFPPIMRRNHGHINIRHIITQINGHIIT